MSSALIACLRSRDTTISVPSRVSSLRVASFMLTSHFLCSCILTVCAGAGRARFYRHTAGVAGSGLVHWFGLQYGHYLAKKRLAAEAQEASKGRLQSEHYGKSARIQADVGTGVVFAPGGG